MYIRVTEIPREGLDVPGTRGNAWVGHLLEGMDSSPLTGCKVLSATLFLSLEGRELETNGSFVAEGECPCDRCSEPVKVRMEREFRTRFVPSDRGPAGSGELELMPDDLDLGFYDGAGIEVNDIFREQVVLAIPAKVLCREECRGLCPSCGADRNREPCDCPEEPGRKPFDVLKTLLQEKE
ncbi:MAG TPA: hypothetical protein DD658_06335 [Deltaproteobacteria bacterium]|nr:MAG: hypothetical protein A2X88_00635 [Deltaproteobacteria bacterium GWC2_65_14]HBO69757.1 hypothetical protein [Deltaproteobacteria bacterium]